MIRLMVMVALLALYGCSDPDAEQRRMCGRMLLRKAARMGATATSAAEARRASALAKKAHELFRGTPEESLALAEMAAAAHRQARLAETQGARDADTVRREALVEGQRQFESAREAALCW